MIDSEYRDMSNFPTSRCWSPTLAQTLMQFTVVMLARML